jgi:hypothetical protein
MPPIGDIANFAQTDPSSPINPPHDLHEAGTGI